MKQNAPSDLTRKRYDRLAFIYDLFESPMEWLSFASWRAALMNKVHGRQVLEVGVGTGKNLPHYPRDIKVIAIDLSPRMLEKAKKGPWVFILMLSCWRWTHSIWHSLMITLIQYLQHLSSAQSLILF